METLLRHAFLFFLVVLAEILHISVLRYGHIVLALILFFVFFLPKKTALVYAYIAGLLEDIIAGPFGFHSILYPLISFLGSILCTAFLTNKSFFAFFILNIVGFFTYHGIGILFFFFQFFIHKGMSLGDLFSFGYLQEIGIGLIVQIVFLSIMYGLQYRRIKFSRAYVYG